MSPRPPAARPEENRLDYITRRILKCARRVRRQLGAGRPIDEYETALDRLMRADQLQYARQYPFGMDFRRPDETGFRADFVVDGWILVELKVVPRLTTEHTAEVHQYLQVSHCKLGLLINFGRQPIEVQRLWPDETAPA